jgi:hypothetical protein
VSVVVMLATACSDDSDDGRSVRAEGDTPCEKWESLGRSVGCSEPEGPDGGCGFTTTAECADEANAWVDCAASDITQCLCESDDALNCEGSFKPDEGPARCVTEYRAFGECAGL